MAAPPPDARRRGSSENAAISNGTATGESGDSERGRIASKVVATMAVVVAMLTCAALVNSVSIKAAQHNQSAGLRLRSSMRNQAEQSFRALGPRASHLDPPSESPMPLPAVPAFVKNASEEAAAALKRIPGDFAFLYTDEGMAFHDDLMNVSRASGIKAALKHAYGKLWSNNRFLDVCHPLMHRYSRAMYRNSSGSRVVDAFRDLLPLSDAVGKEAAYLLTRHDGEGQQQQPSDSSEKQGQQAAPAADSESLFLIVDCAGAYLHGITENFVRDAGKAGNLYAAMDFVQNRICNFVDTPDVPNAKFQCYHGLGHGLLNYERHQATRQALKAALEHTKRLPKESQDEVLNGLWMDHVVSSSVAGEEFDDPVGYATLCVDMEVGHRNCLMLSVWAYLLHRPHAFGEALDYCFAGCTGVKHRHKEKDCRLLCAYGLGSLVQRDSIETMQPVNDVCSKVPTTKLQKICVLGGVKYGAVMRREGKVPLKLCKELHPSLRNNCLANSM